MPSFRSGSCDATLWLCAAEAPPYGSNDSIRSQAVAAWQVLMRAVMWIEPAVAILQHKKRGYLQQPEQVF